MNFFKTFFIFLFLCNASFAFDEASANVKKSEEWYLLGNKYLEEKNYQQALNAFKKSTEFNSSNVYAYNNLGKVYENYFNDEENAIKNYKLAIHSAEIMGRFYYNKGIKSGPGQTLKFMKIGGEYEKAGGLAMFNLGMLYYRKGMVKEGIEECTNSTHLKRKFYANYMCLGHLHRISKNYNAAIEHYTTAIEFAPTRAELYAMRAGVYELKKDYETCIKETTQAIEIEPSVAYFYFNRGICEIKNKNTGKALSNFLKAQELGMANAGLNYELCFVYHEIEQNELALKHCKQAIEAEPQNKNYQKLNGLVQQVQNKQQVQNARRI